MNEFTLRNLGKAPLHDSLAQKAEALARGAAGKDALERKRAAQEFASFLYLEVLKAMRATLPKDGLFENDTLSRDIYTSMFDTEMARVLAKRDATGFTKTIERAIDTIAPKPRANATKGGAVSGVVSSGFGARHDPIHGRKHFHSGVDIAAPAGAEVKAPASGKVTFSGLAKGYGNLVQIDHGDGMVPVTPIMPRTWWQPATRSRQDRSSQLSGVRAGSPAPIFILRCAREANPWTLRQWLGGYSKARR